MIEKHKFYYEVSTAWCCLGQRVDTDECDTVTVEAKNTKEAYKLAVDRIYRKHSADIVYLKTIKFLKSYTSRKTSATKQR